MGLLSAVVKLASGAPMFALLWRADDEISDGLAAVLVDMNGASFILTWALDAVMLASAGGVILSTRCLPRWLGWWPSRPRRSFSQPCRSQCPAHRRSCWL